MTTTSTGLTNIPDLEQVAELEKLCRLVLEPWRAVVGALRITSGFRSPAVNLAVGGSRSSDHMRGRAADVVPLTMALSTAWLELVTMSATLPIDQAIIYVRQTGQGWIHVSTSHAPRHQLLVDVHGVVPWLGYRGKLVT